DRASSSPPPRALPWMAAITGLGLSSIRALISEIFGLTGGAPNSLISAPAKKVRPAQISTTAFNSGSAMAPSMAATSCWRTASPRALTGGASVVIRAMAPWRRVVTTVGDSVMDFSSKNDSAVMAAGFEPGTMFGMGDGDQGPGFLRRRRLAQIRHAVLRHHQPDMPAGEGHRLAGVEGRQNIADPLAILADETRAQGDDALAPRRGAGAPGKVHQAAGRGNDPAAHLFGIAVTGEVQLQHTVDGAQVGYGPEHLEIMG